MAAVEGLVEVCQESAEKSGCDKRSKRERGEVERTRTVGRDKS